MKSTTDYLDQLKRELGLQSDYAIAKLMGTTTSRISNYRKGHSRFDDETSVWVAGKLNISPFVVIAHMRAIRAKDAAERTLWEKLAEKAMGIAPSVAGTLFSSAWLVELLAKTDTHGIVTAGISDGYGMAAAGILYIMSNYGGRTRRSRSAAQGAGHRGTATALARRYRHPPQPSHRRAA